MHDETTNPGGMRVIRPDEEAPSAPTAPAKDDGGPKAWLAKYAPWIALVTSLGGGGAVYKVINWPWPTKEETKEQHAEMQKAFDARMDKLEAKVDALPAAVAEEMRKPRRPR